MNVPTITMEPAAAHEAFLAYRDAVRKRANDEDAAIMRGYQALAKGNPVLNLHDVMKAAGVDDQSRPKLAICRSDAQWCFYRCADGVSPRFVWGSDDYFQRGRVRSDKRIELPRGTLPPCLNRNGWRRTLRAMVPPVPPALRPAHALSNYFTLWEAEWEDVVPVDPLLLKHLGGPLYAVLAAWDLTDLERSVLAGRLTQ